MLDFMHFLGSDVTKMTKKIVIVNANWEPAGFERFQFVGGRK